MESSGQRRDLTLLQLCVENRLWGEGRGREASQEATAKVQKGGQWPRPRSVEVVRSG